MSVAMTPSDHTIFEGAFAEIPIVSLGARHGKVAERADLARRLGDICHHIGFAIVTDHGVNRSIIDGVFNQADRFFSLSEADKRRIDKKKSRHFRGWEPVGAEATNNRPDMREQIDLWTDHPPRPSGVIPDYLNLLGPNQWPDEAVTPGFRQALESWFGEMGALADDILRLIAISLDLNEGYFEVLFGDEPMSLTKLIHYPETPLGEFGVNAHHDAGILTVLAPGGVPGLEVENGDGDWIPVPIIKDSLVINLGEILQKMTGNYLVATPHRVMTRAPRVSVGYFHGPSLDMKMQPLPLHQRFADAVANSSRHANAGFMAQADETNAGIGDMKSHKHPDVYGEQLWNYFKRSYPENMARHYPDS